MYLPGRSPVPVPVPVPDPVPVPVPLPDPVPSRAVLDGHRGLRPRGDQAVRLRRFCATPLHSPRRPQRRCPFAPAEARARVLLRLVVRLDLLQVPRGRRLRWRLARPCTRSRAREGGRRPFRRRRAVEELRVDQVLEDDACGARLVGAALGRRHEAAGDGVGDEQLARQLGSVRVFLPLFVAAQPHAVRLQQVVWREARAKQPDGRNVVTHLVDGEHTVAEHLCLGAGDGRKD
mmetsp:Transcript_6290/g.14524  ORF Transcript_6290/g.14524 Transcript_6290/m.14524 type:complete len:233 (+) Transcript_6290:381-1079(+)